ncbi:hypothetical protein [Amycolatopsis nalaikhensis]|uniref:Uncharacterized protein n=1 Tax=Amycolatopsis nalaikhensis TaxID=715472 RepID=A0ABY8XD51_9PSEU|nr:hypothetical protein [Amycolatopsis sp. 2-2]WIV53693.1 hypothetical protein QP939_33065 [Amycolatopsis sp. 2-2]
MTDSSGPGRTPEELAAALRATARSAATSALREGLEDIDDRYGHDVADQVAGLIDVAEVFAGLTDPNVRGGRTRPAARDDDEPWEFKPVTSM